MSQPDNTVPEVEDTVVTRGEVDCFGCFKRMLGKDGRKVLLAPQGGMYCDGVVVNFCGKPECQRMADVYDAKHGRPDEAALSRAP